MMMDLVLNKFEGKWIEVLELVALFAFIFAWGFYIQVAMDWVADHIESPDSSRKVKVFRTQIVIPVFKMRPLFATHALVLVGGTLLIWKWLQGVGLDHYRRFASMDPSTNT